MQKQIISSELASAIELAIKSQGSANAVLSGHHDLDWCMGCEPLNSLNHIELAELLINGYEVIKTPEEEIIELCLSYKNNRDYGNGDVRSAIRKALDIVGFEIDWIKLKNK